MMFGAIFAAALAAVPTRSEPTREMKPQVECHAGEERCSGAWIQGAVDTAAASGGGRVTVPVGEWETGPIRLRSNVELNLEEGATLRFSEDPSDYLPAVETSWQGTETRNLSPLVYANGATNVSITGKGVLKTCNAAWDRWHQAKKSRRGILRCPT